MAKIGHNIPRSLGASFDALDEVFDNYQSLDPLRFLGAIVAGYDPRPDRHTVIYDIIDNFLRSTFDEGRDGSRYITMTDDGEMQFTAAATKMILDEVAGTEHYKRATVSVKESLHAADKSLAYLAKCSGSRITVENEGPPEKTEPLPPDRELDFLKKFDAYYG